MFKITPHLVRSALVPGVLAGFLVASVAVARASDISFLDTFDNVAYEQTGNGNSLTLNGYFYSADLNSTVSNSYTSASFTPPGGSPTALTAAPGSTDYHYQTGLYPTLSAMQTAFPFGSYSFSGMNGGTTDTATLDYTANDFPITNPYLTGTDYSALQGMNAAQSFTFDLSPFTPGTDPNQAYAFIFLTVYDYTTGATVFDEGFLPDSTTSIVMPGGTLTAGDEYDYEIDYSDRDIVSGTGADFSPQLGFDSRTDGTFETASAPVIPEPSSLVLLGTGLLGVAGSLRRRFS